MPVSKDLTLFISKKIKGLDWATWKDHLQKMTNRRAVGGIRYGSTPKKDQSYMTRMIMEMKAYKRTGNYENLLNIAVYTYLESQAPENPKFHFDPTVDSVTRGKI